MSGRLVVFEGLDGVGKTAILQAAAAAAGNTGLDVVTVAFPGRAKGSIGEFVYAAYERTNEQAFSAGSVQALHVAAHLNLIEKEILPALRAGRDVLLDRFYWSTLAYGIASDANPEVLRSLVEAEIASWSGVKPHVLFLVERAITMDVSSARVAREYEKLLTAFGRQYGVVRLHNIGTVEDAVRTVMEHL